MGRIGPGAKWTHGCPWPPGEFSRPGPARPQRPGHLRRTAVPREGQGQRSADGQGPIAAQEPRGVSGRPNPRVANPPARPKAPAAQHESPRYPGGLDRQRHPGPAGTLGPGGASGTHRVHGAVVLPRAPQVLIEPWGWLANGPYPSSLGSLSSPHQPFIRSAISFSDPSSDGR